MELALYTEKGGFFDKFLSQLGGGAAALESATGYSVRTRVRVSYSVQVIYK